MRIKKYNNFEESKNQIGNFNNFEKLFEDDEFNNFDEFSKKMQYWKKNFIDAAGPHPIFDSIRIGRICEIKDGILSYTTRFYKNTLRDTNRVKLEKLNFFTDLEDKIMKLKKNFKEENVQGVNDALYELKYFLESHSNLLIFNKKKMDRYIHQKRDDDPYKKYQLFGNMHELILDIFKKRGM
jgi:hypothetical protein